jgi:hypothetical protein
LGEPLFEVRPDRGPREVRVYVGLAFLAERFADFLDAGIVWSKLKGAFDDVRSLHLDS